MDDRDDPDVPPHGADSTAPAPDGAATPSGRAAPPTSRAIAMFAVVFVFFGLLAAAAWFIGGGSDAVGCNSDAGPTDPGGVPYNRDRDQGCQFVDGDGNVVPDQ